MKDFLLHLLHLSLNQLSPLHLEPEPLSPTRSLSIFLEDATRTLLTSALRPSFWLQGNERSSSLHWLRQTFYAGINGIQLQALMLYKSQE